MEHLTQGRARPSSPAAVRTASLPACRSSCSSPIAGTPYLLTNLDPQPVPASQVLARYKNQPATSERQYHDLKGGRLPLSGLRIL
jgi:hypothetical protein